MSTAVCAEAAIVKGINKVGRSQGLWFEIKFSGKGWFELYFSYKQTAFTTVLLGHT